MTKDKVLEKVKKVYGDLYDYSLVDEVTKKDRYVRLICPKHGLFLKRIDRIKEGHCGCPKCSGKVKKDLEQFIEEANKVHDNKYSYEKSVYINSHTKVIVTCPIHGDFLVSPTNHISGKNGCPKCRNEVLKKKFASNTKEFISKAKKVHGDKYDYSKVEYINNSTKVDIICSKHGIFSQAPHLHLRGEGCPRCTHTVSKWEVEVGDFIKSLGIDIEVSRKNLIDGQEIDIFIPQFNLGIECDGLYWHSELYRSRNDMVNKTKLAKEHDIELIHIFEDEWIYKQDIVKSLLRNKLHKNSRRIYARQCVVKEVSSSISNDFLDRNHLQGHVNSKIRLGLYYNDELVSVMTFGSKRILFGYSKDKTKTNEYELLRFCNILDTSVIGGASKLFKYMVRMHDEINISTFCDLRYSNGNIYKTLGFEYLHTSTPNYYYIVNKKRENRFKYRKSILVSQGFDSNKSEHEIMLGRGIYRIYDCGTNVYEYKQN